MKDGEYIISIEELGENNIVRPGVDMGVLSLLTLVVPLKKPVETLPQLIL